MSVLGLTWFFHQVFELENPVQIKITQTSTASAPSPSAPTISQVSNVQRMLIWCCLHIFFFIFLNDEKVYYIIILIRVDVVCTNFFFISQWSQSQRQLSSALEVSTPQVLLSLEKQMQMQILSQETWSVSPGSTAHPLTSRVIIFKHCNCLCSVHLKDNLKRNKILHKKFKMENLNFLKKWEP